MRLSPDSEFRPVLDLGRPLAPRVHQLSNGVRLVCDPMPGLQSTALSVVIRGGARWESEATNGWSHLLEHMVFKGAGDRSAREIVEVIEAQGGQINAATGYERTSFQVRCLGDGLPLAIGVIADLVRRPTLDGAELERERGVIGQEIAEAADTPDDRIFDLAQGCAFAGQSLGRPILGSVESIGRADAPTLAAFHRALYAPERTVISVSGAVDPDAVLKLAELYFGDAAAPKEKLAPPYFAEFVGGDAVETRALEQAHLVMLLPGVGARDPDYYTARLFAEALGGGMASRLFQEAREARGLAYAIDAYHEAFDDAGLFGVYAGTAAADATETARLAAEQIRDLAEHVTDAELARAKALLKAHLFMARESPLARAEQNAGQLFLFDRLLAPAELAAGIEAVTAADFARFGERLLAPGRSTVAVLGPKRAAAAAPEAFRAALA